MENRFTKSKKIMVLLGAFCLCGIVAFGALFGCLIYKRKGGELADVAPGGMQVTAPETAENGVRFAVKQLSKEQLRAYGISEQTESAVEINATVEPVEAVRTILDWELSFVDETSEWATGKTVSEYVEMTVSENNRKVVLSCKKCFGEQMKVTATVRNNKALQQECTVDYLKRVESVTAGYRAAGSSTDIYTLTPDIEKLEFGVTVNDKETGTVYFDLKVNESEAYTIDDTFTTKFYAVFSEKFVNAVKNSVLCSYVQIGENDSDQLTFGYTANKANERVETSTGGYGGWGAASLMEWVLSRTAGTKGGDYQYLSGDSQKMNALRRAIDAMEGEPFMYYEIESVGALSTYTRRIDVSYAVGYLDYDIESISIDRAEITF